MVTLFLLLAAMDHPRQAAAATVGGPRGHEAEVEKGPKPLTAGSAWCPAQPDGRRALPAHGLLPPLLWHGRTPTLVEPDAPSVEMSCDPAGAQGAMTGLAVPLLPAWWHCPDCWFLGCFGVSLLLPGELGACLVPDVLLQAGG